MSGWELRSQLPVGRSDGCRSIPSLGGLSPASRAPPPRCKMGAQNSLPQPVPDLEEIMTETGFSQANVTRLYQRFQALDKDEKGYLSKEDLQGIGELAVNPIGDRIVDAFFRDGRKTADFRTFAHVLAHFRPVEGTVGSESINSRLSKLKFAFQLYDQDKDGKISRAELLQVLRMMIGVQVTDEQLESITDRTIQEADQDGDHAISFQEFSKAVEKLNIEQKMSLRILK